MDIRWACMRVLCKALHKVGRRRGKFVFAVAVSPNHKEERVEVQVADTTAVHDARELVNFIMLKHMEAMAQRLKTLSAGMPAEVRAAMELECGQTWRADEVGQA